MPLWRDPKSQKWRMRYYVNGTAKGPRVMKTLPAHYTHAEADRLYKLELAKAAGRRGRTVPRDLTVKEAVTEYLVSRKGAYAPDTFKNVTQVFEANIVRLLGGIRVATLRPSDFISYQQTRTAEGIRPATINREMDLLRAMLNVVVKWGWIETTPMPPDTVPRLRAPKNRVDFLSPDDWKALLVALENARPAPRSVYRRFANSRDTVPIMKALLYTGARVGELVNLRWEAVDLDRGRIVLDRRKTDSTTGLMISAPLRAVLEALPRGTPQAHVFTRTDGTPWERHNIQSAFYRARDRAGLRKGLSVHSLRHSFASWLVADGVPLRTVAELLGHSNITQTARYAHLAPENLREAVDRIATIEARGKMPDGNRSPTTPTVVQLDERRQKG